MHLKASGVVPFTGALETHVFCLLLSRINLIDYEFALDKELGGIYSEHYAEMRMLVSSVVERVA